MVSFLSEVAVALEVSKDDWKSILKKMEKSIMIAMEMMITETTIIMQQINV